MQKANIQLGGSLNSPAVSQAVSKANDLKQDVKIEASFPGV
jgi:hypothetical protein